MSKHFPIQGFSFGIPWSAAERAYKTYAERYGKEQSLERLAERGGFGLYEFAFLYLNQYPRNNATCSDREGEIGKALSEALKFDKDEYIDKLKKALRSQLGRCGDFCPSHCIDCQEAAKLL